MPTEGGETGRPLLQRCPACGVSLDHDVPVCPDCGQRIPVSRSRTVVAVIAVVAVVVAIAVVAALWMSSSLPISPDF